MTVSAHFKGVKGGAGGLWSTQGLLQTCPLRPAELQGQSNYLTDREQGWGSASVDGWAGWVQGRGRQSGHCSPPAPATLPGQWEPLNKVLANEWTQRGSSLTVVYPRMLDFSIWGQGWIDPGAEKQNQKQPLIFCQWRKVQSTALHIVFFCTALHWSSLHFLIFWFCFSYENLVLSGTESSVMGLSCQRAVKGEWRGNWWTKWVCPLLPVSFSIQVINFSILTWALLIFSPHLVCTVLGVCAGV